MRYVIIIMILQIVLTSTASEVSKVDSLFNYLETLSEKKQADTLKRIIVKNIFRDPKTTFVYVNKFSTLPEVSRDSMYLCQSYYWKGMIYEIFGDYQKAIENDFISLDIATKIKNKKLVGITLNNIGLVYSYQEPYYDKALVYFKEYLKTAKDISNETEIMGANMNIGMQFKRMSMYDSSEYYYNTAFGMSQKLNNKRYMALSYSFLAEIENIKGNDKKYREYVSNAMRILKEEGYMIDLAALYYDISGWFLDNNTTDSALYYAKVMMEISTEYELVMYRQNALLRISDIYEHSRTYDKAYYNLKEFIELKDSITSQETKEKLAQLQTIYEVEIKDKEIENLRIREKLQQKKESFYLFLILGVIMVLGIVIFYFVMKHRKNKLLNAQKMIISNNEKELSRLELEKSKANEKELETQLAFKTRQLTTHAVSMMQKNRLMHELSESMIKVKKYANIDQKDEIRKLQHQIKRSLNVEKDWDLFKMYFEQVNKDFFVKLLLKEPTLSPNDLKLSALIRLNMNIKEAASVFNVEPASVKSARYRLRKKLGLKQEDDLYDYMRNV